MAGSSPPALRLPRPRRPAMDCHMRSSASRTCRALRPPSVNATRSRRCPRAGEAAVPPSAHAPAMNLPARHDLGPVAARRRITPAARLSSKHADDPPRGAVRCRSVFASSRVPPSGRTPRPRLLRSRAPRMPRVFCLSSLEGRVARLIISSAGQPASTITLPVALARFEHGRRCRRLSMLSRTHTTY